jgi:hypothetical protein
MPAEISADFVALYKQIRKTLYAELKTVPAHGKVCFELTWRDGKLQRILTIREVSRLMQQDSD